MGFPHNFQANVAILNETVDDMTSFDQWVYHFPNVPNVDHEDGVIRFACGLHLIALFH